MLEQRLEEGEAELLALRLKVPGRGTIKGQGPKAKDAGILGTTKKPESWVWAGVERGWW